MRYKFNIGETVVYKKGKHTGKSKVVRHISYYCRVDTPPEHWYKLEYCPDGILFKESELSKEGMDYEEIEAQALKDFVEAPQKALLNSMIADQEHRKAFKKILKEKGSVTLDDLRNELNNSLKKK